jgi:murein L,D-transpeptidase YafK
MDLHRTPKQSVTLALKRIAVISISSALCFKVVRSAHSAPRIVAQNSLQASNTNQITTREFKELKPFLGTPEAFVSLGIGGLSNTNEVQSAYGIVVEKNHHRLTLFRYTESNTYEIVKTYRAITGKDPSDKVTKGDLRTPEGIYFVTGRLEDKELPAKYGRLALTLDYPNIFDQRKNKSGYGIWIHATDDAKRLQKPYDTEGCVVVSNEDILDLQSYIRPFQVPVVITKEMKGADPLQISRSKTKALELIEDWRSSWENSEFSTYMSYYSKDFKSLGKSKQGWQQFKQSLSKRRDGEIEVKLSEPKIVAFQDQLLVVFHQLYKSPEHSDFGKKFLYLKWEQDRYTIIAEKWYKEAKIDATLNSLTTTSQKSNVQL